MKILKTLIYVFSGIFILTLLGLFIFINGLPGPEKIAQHIPSEQQMQNELTIVQSSSANLAGSEKNNTNPLVANESAEQVKKLEQDTVKRTSKKLDQILFDHKAPLLSACENLSKAPNSEFLKSNFPDNLDAVLDKDLQDPFLQAFTAPIKKAIRLPKFQKLFQAAEPFKNKESNLLQKTYFYTLAAQAVAEFHKEKPQLNKATDRAYRVFALAKAIHKKPELANDPSTMDFCKQIQNSVSDIKEFDHQEETAEFLRFLEYAGIKPDEIDYDPALETNIDIEFDKNSIQMGLGWISKEMSAKK